jgi:hypothetical protein
MTTNGEGRPISAIDAAGPQAREAHPFTIGRLQGVRFIESGAPASGVGAYTVATPHAVHYGLPTRRWVREWGWESFDLQLARSMELA